MINVDVPIFYIFVIITCIFIFQFLSPLNSELQNNMQFTPVPDSFIYVVLPCSFFIEVFKVQYKSDPSNKWVIKEMVTLSVSEGAKIKTKIEKAPQFFML